MAIFSQLICGFIGVLLLSSALAKFRDPATFREIILDYRLPQLLKVIPMARVVPALESLLGLGLLSLFQPLSLFALGGSLLFVGIATVVVARRVMRGERSFRCGCEGDLRETKSAAAILLRNTSLIAIIAVAGIIQTQIETSVWSMPPPIYLASGGLMLCLRLTGAAVRAMRSLNAWKVDG